MLYSFLVFFRDGVHGVDEARDFIMSIIEGYPDSRYATPLQQPQDLNGPKGIEMAVPSAESLLPED